MKKYLLFLFLSVFYPAQIVFNNGNAEPISSNPSISVEFGAGNLGLVLPYVTNTSVASDAVNGTLLFEVARQKVMVLENGMWRDLSGVAGNLLPTFFTEQNSRMEDDAAKVTVGTESTTPGILVLEEPDKAMVLPKVPSPHLNIINPAPGMIAYDPVRKQLAVFNGTVWSFWE